MSTPVRLVDITPVILTYNEEANIGRVLAKLSWAKDVVVVDSYSTDRTREIIGRFRNARVLTHEFESHAAQWKYATDQTGITTDWILVLDSDYVLSDELIEELQRIGSDDDAVGWEVAFRYFIHGRPLPRSIYPARIILCRRDRAHFYQDGHTQRLAVTGSVRRLQNPVYHDDRKALAHWITAQDRYARLERVKLRTTPRAELGMVDRLRVGGVIAPVAVLLHCLFVKGLILHGISGWYYAYQRATAEFLLSLYMMEDRLAKREQPDNPELQA
jgi:glycosyltransferase involved in cell wall biosynthesis